MTTTRRARVSKAAVAEGTWFALPLRSHGYAAGIVARASPTSGGLLLYVFAGVWPDVPPIEALTGLRARDALRVLMAGDLGFLEESWQVIGRHSDWHRDEWPLPLFVRRDPLARRAWCVRRTDRDVNKVESEDAIAYDTALEPDALYGAGAVEILLTRLLGGPRATGKPRRRVSGGGGGRTSRRRGRGRRGGRRGDRARRG